MSYNKLHFSAVEIVETKDGITVQPTFRCPKCGNKQPTKVSAPTITINKASDTNTNTPTTFTLPCCGTAITLNVAVHKPKDKPATIHISKPEVPILSEWWIT